MSIFITNKEKAAEIILKAGGEFAVVNNPDYVFEEFSIYPLAPKLTSLKDIVGIVMDMDGTTTTTEDLCLHSLEFMVRKMSNLMTRQEWDGLDHIIDLPNVIGNSTTKHVEYLINKYQNEFQIEKIKEAFVYSVLWNIVYGQDKQRKIEVLNNARNLFLSEMFNDEKINYLRNNNSSDIELKQVKLNYFYEKYLNRFPVFKKEDLVRIGIDIYYQRYHEILQKIKLGKGNEVSKEVFGVPDRHLIASMEGIEIFLPLVKGLMGENVKYIIDYLIDKYCENKKNNKVNLNKNLISEKLVDLSNYFIRNPAKVAVVTSSIFYEADIVLSEVFKVLSEKIDKTYLPDKCKNSIINKFEDYKKFYDVVVTASDSSEIRLKPHRDLYSIALYQLGIQKRDFDKVIGFEDSESGTVAIRAAGIGCCVAVPFAHTSGHNLSAASYIAEGGLPEVLVKENLFMRK
ncbi:MAG: HAD family phosphatase [Ignavibacteriales bacterium]|nr:HAD family phosphatase [Ignavibacteriales bacterium]